MMAGTASLHEAAAGDLQPQLAVIRQRIGEAGADPAAVEIVAVTKGFDFSAVASARRAGLCDIGENYAQELFDKAEMAARAVQAGQPADLRWHYLGSPQRNKIGRLVPIVALWHGVDRVEVLEALARRRCRAGVLIEVNVGGEAAKHGCDPAEAARLVGLGIDLGLDVRGLMTVAPKDRSGAARAFSALASMRARLGLAELSMGMSDDYDLAVAEGSTMIRLGRALFGPRPGPTAVRR